MKDSFYFSHDYNSRNDPKLQEILMESGQEGIGVFWSLVEMMYEQGGKLSLNKCERYAFTLRADKFVIDKVIQIAFESNDKNFWSNSVMRRLKLREEKSKKAKKSADIRWGNANAVRTQCDPNAIKERKGKERKGKERKEIAKKKPSIYDLTDIHFEPISEKYQVPISFVRSEYDSMLNWHESTGKKKRDWIATLRNFVKEDAIKLRKEQHGKSKIRFINPS